MRSYFTHFKKAISKHDHVVVDCTGNFLVIKEGLTGAFLVQMDAGEKFPAEVGLGFQLEPDDIFKKLTFYNDTAFDMSIEFYVGRGRINDYRLNSRVTRNILVGTYNEPTRVVATTVPAGATVSIPGTNNGQDRSQISVYNEDPDTTVLITDTADATFAKCYAFSSWTHPTSADLKVNNPTATDCVVGELYPA